jgi:hypothetical protein
MARPAQMDMSSIVGRERAWNLLILLFSDTGIIRHGMAWHGAAFGEYYRKERK